MWTEKYGAAMDVYRAEGLTPVEKRCEWVDGRFPGVEVFRVLAHDRANLGRLCGRYHGKELLSVDECLATAWEVAELTYNTIAEELQG